MEAREETNLLSRHGQCWWTAMAQAGILNLHVEMDAQGFITDCNKEMAHLLGAAEPADLHQQSWLDLLVLSSDVERFRSALLECHDRGYAALECAVKKGGAGHALLKVLLTRCQSDQHKEIYGACASDISERAATLVDSHDQLTAIRGQYGAVEFSLDGRIQKVNSIFAGYLGYTAEQMQGQAHALFVDAADANSTAYRNLWLDLKDGTPSSGEFRFVHKTGHAVWLLGSYYPIQDIVGAVKKVAMFVTDVTANKQRMSELEGKVQGISRSQAVIEFEPDGTIITANDNFLTLMGYELADVQGQHHRMFCDQGTVARQDYRDFWRHLADGQFQSGEFKRLRRDGQTIWIRATYNPIYDVEGHVCKVVKFAMDVTQDKLRDLDYKGKVEAIRRAQAVVEFDLNGNIITAIRSFSRS